MDVKTELLRCRNSMSGEHDWLVKRAKNKNKPDQCVLCNQLLVDLKRQTELVYEATVRAPKSDVV